MFNRISVFFKEHPWLPPIIMTFVVVVLGVLGTNIRSYLIDIKDKVGEVHKATSKLTKSLEANLDGGMPVLVGVNPKEIKENIVYVYDDNKLNLRPGDVIYLTNYTDNTFQTSLRCIVQKIYPKQGNDASSKANIFVSEEAAKRFGFADYKVKGIIELKMRKQQSGGTENKETNSN
jgi:hypothetical protein